MKHETLEFESRALASAHAALLIAGRLGKAIDENGHANLMVSGGSTPQQTFEALSAIELAWDHVTVGLVDDRWVGPEDPRSNEGLVRRHLLRGRAGAAGFLPMKTEASSPLAAVEDREMAYAPHCRPVDVIILGMGNDGHTASWFPGSQGLENALSPPHDECIAAIDATGSPVAGDAPLRMTLTGPAVARAKLAVLLLFGQDKLSILTNALTNTSEMLPIRYAVDKLGPRLTVIWAP